MFWSVLSKYSASSFKRATGIHKPVFLELVQIITDYKVKHRKDPKRGRKAVLSIEDQLMMVLMYLREYRTLYHIGLTYGLSESTVCETIRSIEDIIIKDNRYHLPGKKALLDTNNPIEVVLVDVSESPVERPKKNKEDTIQARSESIQIKPNS
jgi:hypothetical protein